jgi:hypothetical protein
MVVIERPQKWKWGALAVEQKKLDPLLDGLAVLRKEHLTTASVVTAFHKRHVLPLAQRALFMYQMMPEASLFGTQMLDEPVLTSEITQRIAWTVAPELAKDYWFILMHPERGYISLVSTPLYSLSLSPRFLLRLSLFSLGLTVGPRLHPELAASGPRRLRGLGQELPTERGTEAPGQ